MRPVDMLGLVIGIVGIVVVVPSVVRASSLSLRLMGSVAALVTFIALGFGHAQASDGTDCGVVWSSGGTSAAGAAPNPGGSELARTTDVYDSGCAPVRSQSRWALGLGIVPSLLGTIRYSARLRRTEGPDAAA